MKLSKFLALYYGASSEEGDGIDYVTLNEYTLTDVCEAFMTCRADKDYLAEIVAHAKSKGMIEQNEVVE